MPRVRHLSKAAIQEAIFDIKVVPQTNFDESVFELLRDELKDEFPIFVLRQGSRYTFEIKPQSATPPDVEDLGSRGYFFRTEDEKTIIQFRTDGFTLNKLDPYPGYDELKQDINAHWEKYRELSNPQKISRIAMRFINRIPLAPITEMPDLSKYMRSGPDLPPELPQLISSYKSRFTVEEETGKLAAHIVQLLSDNKKTGKVELLLDIDSFVRGEIEMADLHLLDEFDKLRAFKNRLFFNLLTDHILEELE